MDSPVEHPISFENPPSPKERFLDWIKSPGFKKYFKNGGWMFFARIPGLILSFIVTTYVVTYLGPENYGQLSYALSIISIFSIFVTLGIDQVLFRELIEHKDRKKEYLATALILKFIAGIVVMLITILLMWVSAGNSISFWLVSLISFSYLFSCWNVIAYEFQSDVKSKYPAITTIYVSLILNTAKILVVYLNKGIIFLGAIYMVESLLTALFLIYFHHKHYEPLSHWKFNSIIAKKLLADSLPLLFSSAFAVMYTRIDQVMIKHLVDVRSVGLYDAAARISEVWYFIPGLIISSLFPAIINSRKVSQDLYFRRIKILTYFLITVSIFVAIPVTFFAKEIILSIYGVEFSQSITILQIYIWAGIGTSLAYLTQNFLLAENAEKLVFWTSLSAMTVNILLNIILIPKIGITGAAIATLISYFFNSISLLFFKKTRTKILSIFLKTR